MYSATDYLAVGFPHSEIPGSSLAWQLTEAYRSLTTSFFGSQRHIIRRTLLVSLLESSQSLRLIPLIRYSYSVFKDLFVRLSAGPGGTMEVGGIEPPTSCLQSTRSPN